MIMHKRAGLAYVMVLGLWMALLGSLALSTQAATRGMLWQVQSGTATTYLVGSVHFAKPDLYPLSESMLQAFEAAQVVYVEVDMQATSAQRQQAALQQYALLPPGRTLATELSPKTLALFRRALNDLGANLQRFMPYRPNFAAMNVAVMQGMALGYQAGLGVDQYFLGRARGRKEIREIESFEAQMKLLSELPADDRTMQDSLRDMKEFEVLWSALMEAWKQGDKERLYQEVLAKPLRQYPHLKPYMDKVFFERNQHMAAVVTDCLARKERCFVVVGAGHVVGPRGILDILRQQGLKLRQL